MTVRPERGGVTLLELVLVLALLGLLLAISGLAAGFADPTGDPDELAHAVVRARQAALSSRRPISLEILTPDGPAVLTAFPDGRVLAERPFSIDPLTGRTNAEP